MAEQTRQESGYAVGVQEFDWIRERQAVYVDKTEYVWKMVKTEAKYFFLSRPLRLRCAPRLGGGHEHQSGPPHHRQLPHCAGEVMPNEVHKSAPSKPSASKKLSQFRSCPPDSMDSRFSSLYR